MKVGDGADYPFKGIGEDTGIRPGGRRLDEEGIALLLERWGLQEPRRQLKAFLDADQAGLRPWDGQDLVKFLAGLKFGGNADERSTNEP
jgi:hypothetical protein